MILVQAAAVVDLCGGCSREGSFNALAAGLRDFFHGISWDLDGFLEVSMMDYDGLMDFYGFLRELLELALSSVSRPSLFAPKMLDGGVSCCTGRCMEYG